MNQHNLFTKNVLFDVLGPWWCHLNLRCKISWRKHAKNIVLFKEIHVDHISSFWLCCLYFYRHDGACKHIGALLFALSSFTERHRDRHTEVDTGPKCQWDHARKEATPQELDDIDVCHTQTIPLVEPSVKHYNPIGDVWDVRSLEKQLYRVCQSGDPSSLASRTVRMTTFWV
jgi:hypothetical protein